MGLSLISGVMQPASRKHCFKVGECVKLYDTNKADLIYLRNSRELLLVDIIGYLQVFGIEPYGLIPWILNIFCLLSVKWRQ